MSDNSKDLSEYDLFVTEFPKNEYGIVDYLQGRVHFALMDQMKLMSASGMKKEEIKKIILANVVEIINNFDSSKSS